MQHTAAHADSNAQLSADSHNRLLRRVPTEMYQAHGTPHTSCIGKNRSADLLLPKESTHYFFDHGRPHMTVPVLQQGLRLSANIAEHFFAGKSTCQHLQWGVSCSHRVSSPGMATADVRQLLLSLSREGLYMQFYSCGFTFPLLSAQAVACSMDS